MAEIPPTRASLLLRLRDPRDEAAWREFVDLYAPLVYGYVRKQGLQDADAADLCQDVLGAVAGAIHRLDYDPQRGSFRNWLFTVVRHRLTSWRRSERNRPVGSNPATLQLLELCPAPPEMETAWDSEWQRSVFHWACEQVRRDVSDATWQAFWRTAMDGQPSKQAADDLGLSVAAVYIARSRVLARLKELVQSAQETVSDPRDIAMTRPLECPEPDSWPALLTSLPAEQRANYERHLESCPRCQERIDRAGEDQEMLRRLAEQFGDPTIEVADQTLERVRECLHEIQGPVGPPPEEPLDLYFLSPAARPGLLGMLGEYEVQEMIGQGGFGVVLKAYEPALQRLVAIKVLSPALAGSSTARKRFTREAQAAAAVCHDHIVPVYRVHEQAGLPYLVMQYVAGESLQQRLDRSGPLEVVDVVRIGLQTAQGLAAAHAQGLIHRDIKPANLLLENVGDSLRESHPPLAERVGYNVRVKITDFGLARLADDVPLTQQGVVAGTPEYMAPEQARGEPIDHRADLFSLGSVLYALCTGQPPFRAATTLAVLRRVSEEAPWPIRERKPDVPAWLEAFIARLLAKKPDDRFQSAAEVAALLEGYLAHLCQPTTVAAPELPLVAGAGGTGTPGEKEAPPRWWPGALPAALSSGRLAAVLLLALGLGLGWWLLAGDGPEPRPQERQRFFDFRQPLGALSPAVPFGPGAAAAVTTETQGLRVSVPADRTDPKLDVGVELPLRISGNFDIDVGYELLAVGQPTPEDGAGVQLMIGFDSSPAHAAKLTRLRKPPDPFDPPKRRFEHVGVKGETFGAARIRYGQDDKEHLEVLNIRAETPRGRLKLKRVGSQLEYWCVDGKSEYHRFQSREVGRDDVNLVRLICFTGHRPVAVEVRFTDLVIDAERIKETSAVKLPGSAPSRPRTYLWLALGLFTAVFVSAGCLGYYRYRNKGKSPASSPESEPGVEAELQPIAFRCPRCDRKLKAKPELAGKKTRCPQCGNRVAVPAPEDDPAPPPESQMGKGRKVAAVVAASALFGLLIAGCIWMASKSTPAPTGEEDSFRKAVERVRALESDTIDVNSNSDITDKDLAALRDLPNLRHLNLERTSVTDAGMKDVARCTGLVSLYVSWTGVSDAGLAELKDLKRLENLRLDELNVTDAGLVHLQAFPQLRKLSLYRTGVTDAGMIHLKDLFFLEHLSLDQTAVTDSGLRPLTELSNLRYLTVWESKVTDEGVRQIRAALPRLRVNK